MSDFSFKYTRAAQKVMPTFYFKTRAAQKVMPTFYFKTRAAQKVMPTFYFKTRAAQKVMPTFCSRKLFTQTVCNSRTVQLDVSFTHVIFPHNLHLRLRPCTIAKQGHACLPCTSSFPVHVAVTSLHESRSRPLQTLSHAVHPSVAPKDENLTAPEHCRAESTCLLDSC